MSLVGGAAASSIAWPPAIRAQQPEGMRRIGVLMNFSSNDREGEERVTTFAHALRGLGWIEGRNLRIDTRWAADDPDRYRRYSEELVALAPDVILASTSPSVAALQRVTHSVPIVFAGVIDPVGAGFVNSLARPGGNSTGFIAFEYSISAKWLELLREFAPKLKRAAVIRDPALAAGIGQFAVIQSVASSTQLELTAIDSRNLGEIERALAAFADEPNGGVILTAGPSQLAHRETILSLTTQYRLPSIAPFRYYSAEGALASYGPDWSKDFPRAAAYVDRILKGTKPADPPVQAPTKYELVINLKTAKAIGLEVPPSLLSHTDEVIE
jgi:ABC-type uncharacterized transport system substrate-binding protein